MRLKNLPSQAHKESQHIDHIKLDAATATNIYKSRKEYVCFRRAYPLFVPGVLRRCRFHQKISPQILIATNPDYLRWAKDC